MPPSPAASSSGIRRDRRRSTRRIRARIVAAAVKVPGVQAETLRTSLAPLAFSFALATTQTPNAAVARFRKAVDDSSARLTVVRIMRDGVLHPPT
jgi:hypothetical protein